MKTTPVALGLAILAIPAAAFDEMPYSPNPFSSCENGAGLSTTTSNTCLSLTGRALWSLHGSVADGRLPMVQSNSYFGASSQTQNGHAGVAIGLESKDGYEIDAQNNWALLVHSDVRLTDAFVTIGDGTTLSAGLRDPRWGSLLVSPNPAKFWTGGHLDFSVALLGGPSNYGWSTPPVGGGHVIQISSAIAPGLSISGGLERLNQDGMAVTRLDYERGNLSAYGVAYQAEILGDKPGQSGVSIGVAWNDESWRILWRGAVTRTATLDTEWEGRGIVEHRIGDLTLTASLAGTAANAKWYTSVAGELGYALTPELTVRTGAQSGRQFHVGFEDDFSFIEAGIVIAPTESIKIAGSIATSWQDWMGVSLVDHMLIGKATWTPSEDFKATATGRYQGNGAWRYELAAEKRF